ncbi:MAG: PA14 domain-containing protein [Chloroflexota bacterium]
MGRVTRALWRSRAVVLGLAALGCALYGQKLVWVDHEVMLSIRWYAVAVVVMLLGWLGTYKNKSMLVVPTPAFTVRASTGRYSLRAGRWARYLLAFLGFAIALYCSNLIRQDNYSALGGWGWLAGLAIMLLAFVGERPGPVRDLDSGIVEVEDRTDPRPGRRRELVILAGILILAVFLRLYRLDDWTAGMHGDEGEAGLEALNILAGNHVSPFAAGWFEQGNFYYWGIVLGIKLFGASLFGVRFFSVVMGTLMLVPFYLLVRMWFGVRTAIIATIFLTISDVTVQFTRMEASNITTPLALVTGFYFLFLGLRTRRVLPFVLSGFGFMFGLYFYAGARLTPFLIAAVLGYLFIIMPVVRLPGGYRALRRLSPGLPKGRILFRAAKEQSRHVAHYFPQIVLFILACVACAGPFWAYFSEHSQAQNARAGEKLIFNNPDLMLSQYGQSHQVSHAPLYVGLRWPTQSDIFPVVPLFSEPTSLSVKVADDGFWPRVLWAQTTTTLSMFTYRFDTSSFYTFPMEPVAKPIEAALMVLGLAWALWRWRDTRMAMLSLWFWSAIFSGGVLTIDAPYMARLIGVVPVMAIFAALPLSKIAAETVALSMRLTHSRRQRRRVWRASQAVALGAVFALMAFLVLQNYSDYFLRYLRVYPYREVSGQAAFVRDMNRIAEVQGKSSPYYYDVGMSTIYWRHGTNRFLNNSTEGQDMANPSNELPVLDTGRRDIYFMVWPQDSQYLDALRVYYPEGESTPYVYGPPGDSNVLFTAFHLTNDQLLAHRVTLATYMPASGPAVEREEKSFGTGENATPPDGIRYPTQAVWRGNIVAPAYSRYTLALDTTGPGTLSIDGTQVITSSAGTGHAEVALLLARGVHSVQVKGTLQNAGSKVALKWSSGFSSPAAISSQYLWRGEGRGLTGVMEPYSPDLYALGDVSATEVMRGVTSVRVDGFLGFRDSPATVGGQPFSGTWTGALSANQPGDYAFNTYSRGESVLLIDGQTVVNNQAASGDANPRAAQGTTYLDAGDHTIEVRYNWTTGMGYLEVFWQPPGGRSELLTSKALSTAGGIVTGQVGSEPPPAEVQLEGQSTPQPATQPLGGSSELSRPRGVAVDSKGNIYVGDRGNHRVVVYSADGKISRTIGKAPAGGSSNNPGPGELGSILDVAVSSDGTLYVADQSNVSVSLFGPDGAFLRVISRDMLGIQALDGIAVSPDGTLLVSDPQGKQIVTLPLKGDPRPTPMVGDPANRLDQAVDVAPGVGGELYAADLKNRIVRLAPDGKIVGQWSVPVGTSDGGSRLVVSADGSRVYMSDPDRGRVDVLNVETGFISYITGTGGQASAFHAPSGIALSSDGRLYVTDRETNNVQVLKVKE